MQIALWCLGIAYLVIGIVFAILTYEREQGGWLWGVLFWPAILALMIWAK